MALEEPQPGLNQIANKLATIEGKVRLNEQNIISLQERAKLLSENVLIIKKSALEKLENMSEKLNELEKTADTLKEKVSLIENKIAKVPALDDVLQMKKFQESINIFKPEMSMEESAKILNDIMKKTEA